ncbi:outer membrane protein assembly factor BamB family protein [Thermogemmatispora onikobensis]|uniref:outer membrane protein assembly factor BamB family protein n=1 Tax=Thermogemmatispora onikobensis TaxID=732234 RepID=UPI000853596D|nr:PQQ-binding-like beta-propeller repeat protein [Thermogemmatispora onikobensis]
MKGQSPGFARPSWKLFLGCVWLLVGLLGCQQTPPSVSLETVPCPAAQSQVQVSRLAEPAGGDEPVMTTLYVGLSTWLYALDTGSGRPRWCRLLRWKSTPLYALSGFEPIARGGQALYANTADGYLLALKAQNGEIRWQAEMKLMAFSGESWMVPAVDETVGQVYRVALKRVEALDMNNGRGRWSYAFPGNASVYLMPVAAEGMVYVVGGRVSTPQGGGPEVIGLDARTGRLRWQLGIPDRFLPDQQPRAMLLGNGVLCLDYEGQILGIRASDGRRLWQVSRAQWRDWDLDYQPLAIGQGWLYVVEKARQTGQIRVSALRLLDGREGWSAELTGGFDRVAAPLQGGVDGKMLYLVDGQGWVTALDGQNGRILWQKQLASRRNGGSIPSRLVVGGSNVYVFVALPGEEEHFVLHALAKENGQEEWNVALPLPVGQGWPIPVLAG